MDPCLNNKRGQVEDVKSDLSLDLSSLPDPQQSYMDEREHLKVFLRVRPFTSAEQTSGESQDCVTIEPPDTVLLKPPNLSALARLSSEKFLPQTGQRFQFSSVHGPQTSQKELFDGTVRDLVKDVLDGGRSLVFTYGVTNSGKTFTFLGPDSDAGILPRSLGVIFSSIGEKIFTGMCIKPHRCREFSKLSWEQQAEEALFKRSLLRQFKENEKNMNLLNMTSQTHPDTSTMMETFAAPEDKISLNVETNTKFSIWVSFCEIYNENIHDLLEVAPNGAPRRIALRLSQDVKGNAFVKDLRWVQVSSTEEACKVVKLGRKNQSFSSTRLNQLSSRSHSLFSIRVLRIEDIGTPRVHTISELCVCDLAGSERCAKTQNKGERLKEAGNINTSLLILGKCINALRHNQQAKLVQHVPFRESKLTHYLQSFFCGQGKACMIVNINQCASMLDETLNVLKFSAVAQKVVVLSCRPLPIMLQTSSGEVTRNAERKALLHNKRSWDSGLEDVQEDKDDIEETSLFEATTDQTVNDGESDQNDKMVVSKKTHQRQVALLNHLQVQLKKERAENMLLEARVREEICQEFTELFSKMQNDYNERLSRDRDILEERTERRLEIFKNLIRNMSAAASSGNAETMVNLLDSRASELADLTKPTKAACVCSVSVQTVQPADELEGGHDQQLQEAQRHTADEEKQELLLKLQEKSSEVCWLQKQLGDLQMEFDPRGHSAEERRPCDGDQRQETLAALIEDTKEREDSHDALEYQTLGKEQGLASLKEKKAREEAFVAAEELRWSKEETLAMLEKERRHEEVVMEQKRHSSGEALSVLKQEKKEVSRLSEEKDERQQEADTLRQEIKDLTDRLEAAESLASSKTERAEQTSVQLQTVQALLEEKTLEVQEKTSKISALTQEVQRLQLEVQPSKLKDGLRKLLTEEKEENQIKQAQIKELEHQLEKIKQQLEHKQLVSDQQLNQNEQASKQQIEELRKKLQKQETVSQKQLEELRVQLGSQQHDSTAQVEQLTEKLLQQTQASEKQIKQLKEQLREQEVFFRQQLEELELKLGQKQTTSSKLLDQEHSVEQLRAELEEAQHNSTSISSATKDLTRINSDLQTRVASLTEKLTRMNELKQVMEEKNQQLEEKLADLLTASAQKETELHKKLQDMEEQVTSLQRSLQKAQEQREEESQAMQDARRREVERRRELLAVAHEAIAQKDAELEKRAMEISRLKENSKQSAETINSLSLELQRKEDDSSDFREKLADYKKQVQQVQKEISAMREEEKILRQKLSDMDKSKKQLQVDLANRDRTILQLRAEKSNSKSDHNLELYQKACQDLEAKERVMEEMRLTLMEQEDTQEQMEQALEQKLGLIQELSTELENHRNNSHQHIQKLPEDLKVAKEETSQAEENLKVFIEKHQAERKKWLEEKLFLISQAKEAEDKRNQEMRKFAEDRERYTHQHSHLESQLVQEKKTMESWRKDRDTLVAALEVQLKKLLSDQAEKDKLIQKLQEQKPPQEVDDGGAPSVAVLQAALKEMEAEVLQLKGMLEASAAKQNQMMTQTKSNISPVTSPGKPESETVDRKPEKRTTRVSASSQGSAGFPSVLESSEISTENGRTSRFPRPELEISFSPLQPNRMALRRQGEESAVTVKINRAARKRKSSEMEKGEVEAEKKRNTRSKLTPKLTPQKEESSSPVGSFNSYNRKEGTLQKIGDFLQSSPTLLGTKAKKMMSLMSGRVDADSAASSSSLRQKVKNNKRKLFRPEISGPMEMSSHPIISRETEETESDHRIIKRCLRSRVAK
nr:kinesin-like protein KIF20B [Nothobranchius furzeri]